MPALEPVWRPWEPLQLPRRNGEMTRVTNFILQRAHALPVNLAGRPWSLTLGPTETMVSSPFLAAPLHPFWTLDLLWGDAPFQLRIPGQAARIWLAEYFPDLDLPDLPEFFTAALLEAAARAMLAPLSGLGRGEMRIVRIERAGPATHGQEEAWCLQLKSEATDSQAPIEAWMTTSRRGVAHLAACLQDWGPATGPLGSLSLPIMLRAEIGFTWLTPSEWAGLRVGDAILVERPLLAPDGELLLACGPIGLRARPSQGGLVVTTNWPSRPRGDWDMDPDDYGDPDAVPLDDLRRVPLRVAFDVGELRMTVSEVEALQVGQALDLGRPLSEAVQVRINGVRVGQGELVDIDGRLGVVLRSLGNTSIADLSWEPADSQAVRDALHDTPEVFPALGPRVDELPDTTVPASLDVLAMPPPEA